MAIDHKYNYGLCDITLTRNGVEVPLFAQADAAIFTAEPVYIEINNYELGTIDMILDRWNVNFKVSFDRRDIMEIMLPLKKNEGTGDDVGKTQYIDMPSGTSLRDVMAGELKIHPRGALTEEGDITIFCAVPTGAVPINYGKEKTNIEVTFIGLVKDNAVAGDEGNYFRKGYSFTVAP